MGKTERQKMTAEELNVSEFAQALANKRWAKESDWRTRLPAQFNLLPLRIVGKRGKRVRLDKATYEDLDEFCERLVGKRSKDPKYRQAPALRDSLRAASRKTRGVTAGEALGFDFGEPAAASEKRRAKRAAKAAGK